MAFDDFGGILGALGGLGALGSDIYGAYQNYQNIGTQRQTANRLADPNQLAAYTQRLYQPLQGNALDQVNRMLNANLAMRGIQQGAYGSSLAADALAKEDFQRRQLATQQAMQALTGVSGAVPPYQPTNALGQFARGMTSLQQLQKLLGGGGLANSPVPQTNDYSLDLPTGYSGLDASTFV